jgi:ABC-type transporter Mla maintaining outer membrane lipid asymmetry ATPase subunit MlaF
VLKFSEQALLIEHEGKTTVNNPAIEFRNVSLSFDGHTVLSDVTFALAHGEMIFVTGVSGSGKSVLLRLAMGLISTRQTHIGQRTKVLTVA